MKEILLSQQGKNKGKYVAFVDDEDYDFINQWKWVSVKGGNTRYARTTFCVNGKNVNVYMHVAIMGFNGADHMNGNGLDCQKSNMRKATKQQNAMNARINKNGSSKYKGVFKPSNRRHFYARISINYKHIFLGSFTDEIEAAKAYDKKAKELFGEFSRLNFP